MVTRSLPSRGKYATLEGAIELVRCPQCNKIVARARPPAWLEVKCARCKRVTQYVVSDNENDESAQSAEE